MKRSVFRKRWAHFRACRDGVAAIEFALLTPILIVMIIGGATVEEAIVVSRKVTAAAHTLANVTTQYTSVSTDDLSLVLSASTLVLEPYPSTPAKLIVSELSVTSDGTGTVVWSNAVNTTARAVGSTISVPATAVSSSSSDSSSSSSTTSTTTYLIYGEVTYDYTPRMANAYISGIQFSESLFMVPRRSDSIPLTTSST
ncbi:TadE/TadG family type IV pilus assembly protein [Acetobacter conturbans]|uniref:Pilus assembly protein n=1 Tax=Acetobacter conturbans TaxID=1737472 RepID=A0ABX0JYN2_9PROT|nr:TadE/TadG family type IV pilus assembly protein [Acetobacter conturbans]NHN88499.1 pilus assembly protein [Acetobacter conturbans]